MNQLEKPVNLSTIIKELKVEYFNAAFDYCKADALNASTRDFYEGRVSMGSTALAIAGISDEEITALFNEADDQARNDLMEGPELDEPDPST